MYKDNFNAKPTGVEIKSLRENELRHYIIFKHVLTTFAQRIYGYKSLNIIMQST